MFQSNLNLYQNTQLPGSSYSEDIYSRRYNTALSQFRFMLWKGKIFRLKRQVLKSRAYLYDLNVLKPSLHVLGCFYSGIQVVPIRSIIGSEGRTSDFDMEFHAMSEAARQRWVNMAIVHLSRLPLSPIQLIRIGDVYFVRDGHHRISVGRTFGQVSMDAEVITWNAAPPFPWQLGYCAENQKLVKTLHLSV